MLNEGAYSEITKPGMDDVTKMPPNAESGMCRRDIKDWSFRGDRLPNTTIHARRQIGLKRKTVGLVPTPIKLLIATTGRCRGTRVSRLADLALGQLRGICSKNFLSCFSVYILAFGSHIGAVHAGFV